MLQNKLPLGNKSLSVPVCFYKIKLESYSLATNSLEAEKDLELIKEECSICNHCNIPGEHVTCNISGEHCNILGEHCNISGEHCNIR